MLPLDLYGKDYMQSDGDIDNILIQEIRTAP